MRYWRNVSPGVSGQPHDAVTQAMEVRGAQVNDSGGRKLIGCLVRSIVYGGSSPNVSIVFVPGVTFDELCWESR